jgi:hypothetical protein
VVPGSQSWRTHWGMWMAQRAGSHFPRGSLDVLIVIPSPSLHSGLTKEPVLWTLVSKEPPAPAEGTKGAGQDRGQQAALSISWDVPHVLVKDVPDFEQLAPELEAGTVPSPVMHSGLGARGPSTGARTHLWALTECRGDMGFLLVTIRPSPQSRASV